MTGITPHVGHERDVETEAWEGVVTWRTLISGDRTPTAGLTVGSAEIEPGSSEAGARHHHADPEVYYFISGTGLVHIDGVEHPVEAGSVAFIPGDTPHFVRNTGTETLKLMYVFAVDAYPDVNYIHDDDPQ